MGQLEDVFTTAHEFGHAMHFKYSMANQPYAKADAPIFLAEIPSTFFEAMLLEHLLAKAEDKATKMALLTKRLESMRTTIVRQLMFAEFEMLTHEELEKGGALTAERLSELYGQLIRKYYGPDLAADQYDAMEWAYIPHFYYNFYVYKYATSLMAAQVFAKRIVEGDETARAAFIELLKAGGSDYPVDILKKAGLDITDPEVIEESFDLFETTMKQLSALLD
jgi:oligoendopeptidase F